MMSIVNTQIQRAISDAISSQILPQIQSALSAGSGRSTQDRWNVPSERPEVNSEVSQNASSRDNPRSKLNSDCPYDRPLGPRAHDNWQELQDVMVNLIKRAIFSRKFLL